MQTHTRKHLHLLVLAVVLNFLAVSSAFAFSFGINLTFDSSYTTSQQGIFNNAANYWESVITGYQPGYTGVDGISIDVGTISAAESDGAYGLLGKGGWTTYHAEGGGQYFTETGMMEYDVPDITLLENAGSLYDVAVHEIAHVLGFGTWWNYNDVDYVDGSGQYFGAAALAAYQAEFDPSATFVPVELDGSDGTKDGHWDESIGANELMTGWMNTPPAKAGGFRLRLKAGHFA